MQKFVTLNGAKIAYSDVGQGTPIVCVHGWAMNKDTFTDLAHNLSNEFRVISIDLAGHGASRNTSGPYTIERAADDVYLLCEALDLTNIIALGWSMGMHVWWELISRYGEARLAGLVIEDMSPKIYNTDEWKYGTLNGRTIDGIDDMLDDMLQDWTTFSYRLVPRIFAKGLGGKWAALAESAMRDTLDNTPEIMASYWRSMAAQDYRALLPNIKSPTLIMRGGLSQLYGSGVADYLQQELKNSILMLFAQSGHAPHIEQPEQFTKTLANFAVGVQSVVKKSTQQSVNTKKGDHHVQV
ncbi:MAG: hypothetical protein COA43_11435 [Robiginitomaculum sp.]|nr:MAG: hypothetical protein COA43_11435 [Robiginitomaculum sp.]